jgi:hypothetical protein
MLGQIQTYGVVPTANIQINVRGNASTTFANSVASVASFNGTLIVNNGFGNAYTVTNLSIDGVSQFFNIRWGNYTGTPTSGPENLVPPTAATTHYNFLITRNGATYTAYIDAEYYKITAT